MQTSCAVPRTVSALLPISFGIEKDHGSIEVGKYADFVMLDQDLLELEKQDKKKDIFNTSVESTFFEGRQVYQKKK